MEKNKATLNLFYWPLIIGLTLWYSWVIVMWQMPSLNQTDSLLRAFIRVGSLLIPALIYIWKVYPKKKWEFLGLKNIKSGLKWGLGFSLILLLINFGIPTLIGDYEYALPTSAAIWLNHIIGSPITEEVLFRSVVFQELKKKTNTWKSIVISSLLFVILHVPKWILLNELEPMMLLRRATYIFVVGVIFAFLFHKSKSLLGSLIPHWVHNLISMSIVN